MHDDVNESVILCLCCRNLSYLRHSGHTNVGLEWSYLLW
jgi:hypothetical protein